MAALAIALVIEPGIAAETVVPAFIGGAKSDAVYRDPNFIKAARECAILHPFQQYMAETPKVVSACVEKYMKSHGASAQAIAFMRFAPVPAQISELRNYGPVSVAYAEMLFADRGDGWTVIGKSGELIPLWAPADISQDPQFSEFRKSSPDVDLWPDGLTWPRASTTANGGERLVFTFQLKTCHACAIAANAELAYDFDRNGRFLGTHLLKITPAKS